MSKTLSTGFEQQLLPLTFLFQLLVIKSIKHVWLIICFKCSIAVERKASHPAKYIKRKLKFLTLIFQAFQISTFHILEGTFQFKLNLSPARQKYIKMSINISNTLHGVSYFTEHWKVAKMENKRRYVTQYFPLLIASFYLFVIVMKHNVKCLIQ